MKNSLDIKWLLWGAASGAIGGAIGWLPAELLAMPQPTQTMSRYLLILFYFVVIGASIGAAIGALDGVYAGLYQRARQGAWLGGLLGLVGGAIGSLPGELIFQWLSGSGLDVVGRALGWAVVGAIIGLTQGVGANNRIRMIRGGLGGLLGGYLGGGAFEIISHLLVGGAFSRWIAVVLLGLCIGALIAFFRAWLSDARLVVTSSGAHEGKRLLLEKVESWIGCAESDDLPLYQGEGIISHHARVTRKVNGYWLSPGQAAPALFVNDQSVTHEQRLCNGQEIRLGNQRVRFFEQTIACPHCGAENGGRANFCLGCGKVLGDITST